MRLFLDSNVWVSALGTKGLCRDLVHLMLKKQGSGQATVFVSDAVCLETRRVLRDKFHVSPEALDAAKVVLSLCTVVRPYSNWRPPADFPGPDDVAIVGAALQAGADVFITGDKALLDLGDVEGLPIVSPRDAFMRLRGLA